MRYIVFWDFSPENIDKFVDTWRKRRTSGRSLKTLLPPHTLADSSPGISGFTIFETEDEADIIKYVTEYTLAGGKIRVMPIWDSSKGVKLYNQIKK